MSPSRASSADALREQVELVTRSLDDARREHREGDLDDHTLEMIEERDGARLAALRAELARVESVPAAAGGGAMAGAAAPDPGRGRWRRWSVAGLAACAVLLAIGLWDPFSSSPGAPRLTTGEQAALLQARCEEEVDLPSGQAAALGCFDGVLALEPADGEALVESGWLRYELGVERHDGAWIDEGAARLGVAVRREPRLAAAHFYDAVVALQHDHDRTKAIAELRAAVVLPESPSLQSETLAVLSSLHAAP